MGKQKRARQKFHIASVNGRLDNEDTKSESGRSSISMKSASGKSSVSQQSVSAKWKVSLDENLFKNIEIDVDNLKKLNSLDDDRKSVRSISKSIKKSIAESGTNIHLKKKDKRELRKNLFIKKIDAVHQLLHKNKNSKKGTKNELSDTDLNDLPQENMLFFQSEFKQPKGQKPVSTKKRPIAKAKKRKQDMVNNMEAFKKLLTDQKSLGDSLGALTESIQQKVFNEEI